MQDSTRQAAEQLMRRHAELRGVTIEDLRAEDRTQLLVLCRRDIARILLEQLDIAVPDISRLFARGPKWAYEVLNRDSSLKAQRERRYRRNKRERAVEVSQARNLTRRQLECSCPSPIRDGATCLKCGKRIPGVEIRDNRLVALG